MGNEAEYREEGDGRTAFAMVGETVDGETMDDKTMTMVSETVDDKTMVGETVAGPVRQLQGR